ncbi:hypothetical protein HII36_46130 [Nonomuraea sp. NN258]|uniref:hypothetical protein n=1 Tax=Nonomuraea antri TaxID=2730852 RepID=UPI0015681FDB|nr:hypothetical protein [Nonomuraea antri]NRQ39154.1 hypothetical protein [Nonomuraea antri]
MKVRRAAATLSGSALIAAAVVTGVATPAHALPDSCSISYSDSSYHSYCSTGTGYHQILVSYCFVNPWVNYCGSVAGQKAPVGATSSARPPGGGSIRSVTILKSES